MRGEGLERGVMLVMGNEGRSSIRPRIRWINEILASSELSLTQSMGAKRNRAVWRLLIRDVPDAG